MAKEKEQAIHRITIILQQRGYLNKAEVMNALKISDTKECYDELVKIAKAFRIDVDTVYKTNQ